MHYAQISPSGAGNKEPLMTVMPFSYSPDTIERCFKRIASLESAGAPCHIIYDEKTRRIALMEARTSNIEGYLRHKVIGTVQVERASRKATRLQVTSFWTDPAQPASLKAAFRTALQDVQDFELVWW